MSASGHAAHGGHETEDFGGAWGLWAVPFSLAALFIFVLIVVLWVPAAASREMRAKETAGAEESRRPLLEHRAEEQRALASGSMPVERAMRELAR